MYGLSVQNKYGETLDFQKNGTYDVVSVKGLNPPNAIINMSTIATTDGAIFNSSRADKRNIVITIVFHDDIETSRIQLYKFFPIKEPVTLFFHNTTRNVKIEGYVESFECDLFERGQRAQISIVCPQSYFTDEELTYVNFSTVTGEFEFPVDFLESGIEISKRDSTAQAVINYTGDSETGMIIEILTNGNVVRPVIRNKLTNETFVLEIELLTDDKVIINTKRGEKSVVLYRDGQTTNIINKLVAGSTWLIVRPGTNVFSYETTFGLENMKLLFTVDQLYAGV